jgi:hypothetical protein
LDLDVQKLVAHLLKSADQTIITGSKFGLIWQT